jgi:hypothetical protein
MSIVRPRFPIQPPCTRILHLLPFPTYGCSEVDRMRIRPLYDVTDLQRPRLLVALGRFPIRAPYDTGRLSVAVSEIWRFDK